MTGAETMAGLNRDTANANQTVKPIFDKQKIERQQEIDRVMAEVAQQAAPILYQKVGDALQNQPSTVKAAVHGLVGGLMAKAMGGEFASGAAGAAAAALAMEAFGKNIANIDGLNQADKDALTQMMGLVVAKVGGMAAGADSAASNAAAVTGKLATEFNYLKHDELAKKIALQKDCQGGSQQACEGVKALGTISAKRDEQNRDICQQNPAQCRTVLSAEATDLASLGAQRDRLAYQLEMETNPERQAELRTALGEADRNLKNWNSNRIDQLLILEQSVGLTAAEQKELKDRSVLENLPGLAVMQGGVGARRIVSAKQRGKGDDPRMDLPRETSELPRLRQEYVKEVRALEDIGLNARAAGATDEEVARMLHQMRRDLGEQYKDLTPPDRLQDIYSRNIARYGDKLGPSIDWLRAQGKSWEQIIQSATRPGGKDLGF